MKGVDVYLEIGSKRVFACAVDWPGWCRSGPDEAAALRELLDSAPRYAAAMRTARLGFVAPTRPDELRVVERLAGNATTDFGAPGVVPSCDRGSAGAPEYARFTKVLRAAWRALDAAREGARGKALRKGPRGGGRDLDAIVEHVLEADAGYLGTMGRKVPPAADAESRIAGSRAAILAALQAASRGEIEPIGPRGGKRWPVRYFVRRVAWHAIAHAWEIGRRRE